MFYFSVRKVIRFPMIAFHSQKVPYNTLSTFSPKNLYQTPSGRDGGKQIDRMLI